MMRPLCRLRAARRAAPSQRRGPGRGGRPFPSGSSGWQCVRAAAPRFSSSPTTAMTKFGNLNTDSGVQALDDYLGDRSYVEG